MKIVGVHVPGSFAEYISLPEACAWPLAQPVSYEQGAFLEPMGVAMHGVEAAGNLGGKDVLLLGSGPIGVMAAAIAASRGADQVICTDLAPAKLELARKMGATLALPAEGASDVVMEATGGQGADVVIDYSGSGHAIKDGLRALKKGGTMVFVGLPSGPVSLDLTDNVIYKEARLFGVTGRTMYGTWFECQKALESGKVNLAPVVGGSYKLEDFEEAFAAIERQEPGKMLLIP